MPPYVLTFPSAHYSPEKWPLSRQFSDLDETSLRLSLIPSTSRDVDMNNLLHATARSAAFDKGKAKALLGCDPLVIAFPPAIQRLLTSLSSCSFETALLEILVLIAEDEGSFESVADEVEVSISDRLQQYNNDRTGGLQGLKNAELIFAVETLLHAAERSNEWVVHIPFLYATRTKREKDSQIRARRRIWESGMGQQRRKEATTLGIWAAFSAWRLVHISAERIGVDRRELASILYRAMAGKHSKVNIEIRNVCVEIIAGSRRPRHMYQGKPTPVSLPGDLVEQHLTPLIFLSMLESMCGKKRLVDSQLRHAR